MADSLEGIRNNGSQIPTASLRRLLPLPGFVGLGNGENDGVDGPEADDRGADEPVDVEAFLRKSGFVSVVSTRSSDFLNNHLNRGLAVTIWHSASRQVLSGLLQRRNDSPTTFRLLAYNGSAVGKPYDIAFNDFVYINGVEVPADVLAKLMPAAPAGTDRLKSEPEIDPAALVRIGISRRSAATLRRKNRLGDGTDITMGKFLLHLDARTKDDAEVCIARFLTIERGDIDTLLTELEQKDRDVAIFVRTIVEGGDVQAAVECFYKAKSFPDAAKNERSLLTYVNKIIGLIPNSKRFPVLAKFPAKGEDAVSAFKVPGVARFTGRDNNLRELHGNIRKISGDIRGDQNQILVDALVYQYGGLTIEEFKMLPFVDVMTRIQNANEELGRFGYCIHVRNGVAVLGKLGEDLTLCPTIADAQQYTTRFDRYVATDPAQARAKAQAEDARLAQREEKAKQRRGAPIRQANERARKAAIRTYLSATNNRNKRVGELRGRVESFIRATREEIDGVVELLSNAGNRRATAAVVLINSLRTATADDARTCAMDEYASAARVAERNRNPEHISWSVNDAIKNALAARDRILVRAAGRKTVMVSSMPDIAFAHGGFRVITGAIDHIKLLHDRAIEAADKLKTRASRNPYNNGRLLTLALAYQYHGVPLSDLDHLPFLFRTNGDPDLNAVIEKTNVALRKSGLGIHVRNGIAVLGQYIGSDGNFETVPLVANRRKFYTESPLKKAYL